MAFVVAYKSRIITAVRVMPSENMYRTSAIISRGLYIFTPFFTVVYIVERFVFQTIFVLNKEILQFLGQKSAVYNCERFKIKSEL